MSKDYYKILGLDKKASDEEIKKAYRRLAHQFHPDRPDGDESKFKEINEAYQILSNKDKKKQYDQFGRVFDGTSGGFSGFDSGNWEFGFDYSNLEDLGNISDIFDSFFEGLGVRRRKTYHRGSDMEVGLEIDLEDAFQGAEKEIVLPTFVACEHCQGLGHFPKEGFTSCSACDGRGEIRENRNSFFGNISQVRSCAKCFGSGQVPNKVCSYCSGAGRAKQTKKIRVAIASGIHSGQIIKITGAGEAGERGASSGDLYARINIRPHPIFKVKEDDLLITKEINLVDVLLGKKLSISSISGAKIDVEIPSGADLNQPLKVASEGMPRFGSPRRRGDLYILLKITSPQKLSSKARKMLEDLRKEI